MKVAACETGKGPTTFALKETLKGALSLAPRKRLRIGGKMKEEIRKELKTLRAKYKKMREENCKYCARTSYGVGCEQVCPYYTKAEIHIPERIARLEAELKSQSPPRQ